MTEREAGIILSRREDAEMEEWELSTGPCVGQAIGGRVCVRREEGEEGVAVWTVPMRPEARGRDVTHVSPSSLLAPALSWCELASLEMGE